MTNDIAQLDELLTLLFWMEGEGLEASATLSGIARFLVRPEGEAEGTLSRLVHRGDVGISGGQYSLTEVGRAEAARRFVEDFSGMVSQGHGECSDPDCDCRTSPNGAADCHIHAAGTPWLAAWRLDFINSQPYGLPMRKVIIGLTALGALVSSFVATAHCCARLNVLATIGLLKPGWIGLSQYKPQFAASSFLFLGATMYLAVFAPGSNDRVSTLRTGALAFLATCCALLVFVIP